MFDASTLEVFIASTNDLKEERRAVEEVLRDWNASNAKDRQIMLKPIRWEEDSTPELGPGSFQAVINERLLDHADILIGIIGKRLGSPTESAVSGTVEEIERFAAAKKPVLLYFSDREFRVSEINTQELERVREFRMAMQSRGLFLTFENIEDFKARLRSHLDRRLQEFQALLIPAGRALAHGFFKNFVEPTYKLLRGGKVDLADYKLPNEEAEMTLSFSSFRIRIAKPQSLEKATDDAVFKLRKNRLTEINVKNSGMRRAFRVYVPIETKKHLDATIKDNLERSNKGERIIQELHLELLDVVDFPTPLIALNEFVRYKEQRIIRGKIDDASAGGYWQRQKTIQYDVFFKSLDERIGDEGMDGPSIQYFNYDYQKDDDFKLPD
jgi:hypothetical protein